MAKLVVISPDGVQKDTLLRAINTLGRHPDQHVQILDRVVSKEHALITFVDGGYWLQDMGSRNGTYVNGERIPGRTRLNDGDTITLGSTRCVFVEGDRLPEAQAAMKQVTINPAFNHETAIRARLQGDDARSRQFVPEAMIPLEANVRADYEKLRIAFETNQDVGSVLDIDVLLRKILDKAFEFTTADRGVILLLDDAGEPVPRAIKHRKGGSEGQMELSQTILNEVKNEHHAVLSSDATIDSRFGGSHSIILQGIRSTMCVPLLFHDELLGMIHLDTQIATGVFTEKDLQILSVFANQAAVQVANARLAKRAEAEAVARANLSRLLSPNLVEQVVKGGLAMEKGGELRQATVLFSDIRGFTSMSERMPPQKLVSMLNEYFEIMVDIIFQHDGTLDKFVGDEIMAVWGAPVRQEDHTVRAVRAALDMMKALADFNRFRVANGEDAIHVGCGINSGEVVAGYMGSTRTLSFTVIGDTVNTAARLCSAAGAGEILVTDPVYFALADRMQYEERPPKEMKGKSRPVPLYRVLGLT
ncbi:FHA domain-containing protein [Myxococcota bacterium]|nr:FHA domain-containing protein [Myxococcota bacterium]